MGPRPVTTVPVPIGAVLMCPSKLTAIKKIIATKNRRIPYPKIRRTIRQCYIMPITASCRSRTRRACRMGSFRKRTNGNMAVKVSMMIL